MARGLGEAPGGRSRFAWVQAVFLSEGKVWLLISNGVDGQLAEVRATDWVIEKRSW